MESEAAKKKRLSVIAQHRRLGEESLGRLKEEVRRFAVDHTFKETAKKFGIHHSTVSGWVKAGEQVGAISEGHNLWEIDNPIKIPLDIIKADNCR